MSNASSQRPPAHPASGAETGSEQTTEMVIFTKTYDFLAWLTPATNHFPRAHRYGATQRLLAAAYDFLEHITEANNMRAAERLRLLAVASGDLDKVRLYLRLADAWRWITPGQYKHTSALVAEMGRLLGGWQKKTRQDLDEPRKTRVAQ